MDLAAYLQIIRRRWWVLLLAIAISVGAAYVATTKQTKIYSSSTRLLVSGGSITASGPNGTPASVDDANLRALAAQRALAFSQLATTTPALTAARAKARVVVETDVSATASGTDPFLKITVKSPSPQAAQALAASFVSTLEGVAAKLGQTGPPSKTPLLSTLDPAELPLDPTSPKPARNLGIGALVGLILGLAFAVARETLDTSVRTSEALQELTGRPLLGTVPKELGNERLPARTKPHSRRSEAYRKIRTSIQFSAEPPPGVIVITSPGAGDGKSTLAANLAVVAGRTGRRVVLVDADLRRPVVDRYLGIPRDQGLTDVLHGQVGLPDALKEVVPGHLWALTSGSDVANPSELIGSAAMESLVSTLGRDFDLVLIDTPPVLAVTDAMLLAAQVDGVVMVIRLGDTSRREVRRSLEAVDNINATLIGLVANGAFDSSDKPENNYYYAKRKAGSDDEAAPVVAPASGLQADRAAPPVAEEPVTRSSPVPEPVILAPVVRAIPVPEEPVIQPPAIPATSAVPATVTTSEPAPEPERPVVLTPERPAVLSAVDRLRRQYEGRDQKDEG